MTTPSDRLNQLLPSWYDLLSKWSLDGSLSAAAQQALVLNGTPDALSTLITQWSAGDFRSLPPIVLLSSAEMGGAMGAYAISTGTIYLNGDWLSTASSKQVLAVLTEELGHYLDALLNATDTPGDEGETFSRLLFKSKADLTGIQQQNDAGTITVNGQSVAVELAAGGITAPAGTVNLTSPNLSYTVSISGTNAGADLLVAAYTASGTLIGWQVVNRATSFNSPNLYEGVFNFGSSALNKINYSSIVLRAWQGTAGSSYGTGSDQTPVVTYGKTTSLAKGSTTGFTVNSTTSPTSRTGAISFSFTKPTSGSTSWKGTTTFVDTIAPTIGTLSLINYIDTGSITNDRISTDNAFSISLSSRETGSTLIYERSIDGTNYTSTTASQSALSDGSYWYRAKVSDTAGNTSTSNVIKVQVDTKVTTGTLTVSSASPGIQATATTSSSFNLGLSGNEAGSSAAYERSSDNGTTWTATTQTQSNLTSGTYLYRAKVTDIAGNIGYTESTSVSVNDGLTMTELLRNITVYVDTSTIFSELLIYNYETISQYAEENSYPSDLVSFGKDIAGRLIYEYSTGDKVVFDATKKEAGIIGELTDFYNDEIYGFDRWYDDYDPFSLEVAKFWDFLSETPVSFTSGVVECRTYINPYILDLVSSDHTYSVGNNELMVESFYAESTFYNGIETPFYDIERTILDRAVTIKTSAEVQKWLPQGFTVLEFTHEFERFNFDQQYTLESGAIAITASGIVVAETEGGPEEYFWDSYASSDPNATLVASVIPEWTSLLPAESFGPTFIVPSGFDLVTGSSIARDEVFINSGDSTIETGLGQDLVIITGFEVGTMTLTDFDASNDRIMVASAVFTGLGTAAAGAMSSSAIYFGSITNAGSSAFDYDQSSGSLFYNNAGSWVQIAQLNAGTALSTSNFLVG